jgi:DNA replication factor GINS
MKRLEQSDFDKVESMLNSLVRKRHGKIIHLADSSKLTTELANKMTVEEREFYNNLHNISREFTKQIIGEHK